MLLCRRWVQLSCRSRGTLAASRWQFVAEQFVVEFNWVAVQLAAVAGHFRSRGVFVPSECSRQMEEECFAPKPAHECTCQAVPLVKAKNEFGELPPPELCVLPDTLGQHRWGPYTQPS